MSLAKTEQDQNQQQDLTNSVFLFGFVVLSKSALYAALEFSHVKQQPFYSHDIWCKML